MKSFRMSRRALLRGAGGVAIGLPFLEIMAPRGRAQAAMSAPKRYINFFSPNGTIYSAWAPTAGTSPSAFTLSRILQPLAANQKSLVVLDGLMNLAGTKGNGDDHMRGMGAMLTGIELAPGTTMGGAGTPAGLAGGISVDQVIANQIGAGTKLKSLELGVESGSAGTVWGYTSYTAASQPLPPDNSPASVFTRVFAQLGTSSSDAQRLAAERKSVLDAVIANYAQVNPRLGAADRAKLDAHLTTVRDLETRVTATGGSVGASCVKPAMPTGDFKMNASFPTVAKLQMDLLVMAMACDQTRVGTLQFENSVGGTQFSFVDPTITRGHHDMSHDDDSNADTMEKLTKINVWYAQQLNYLVEALKAVPEPLANGTGMGTMLDNTVIVWCNELAKGNVHSHSPQPFVLAGGAGGALQTGRYLQFNGKIPHNNLLVSLINLMGGTATGPATTFGNPAYCTGPLTGV